MRFTPAVNIHALDDEARRRLQPGQWVYATDLDARGRFWGVKPSGTVVVSWHQNARNSGNVRDYWQAHRDYARAR